MFHVEHKTVNWKTSCPCRPSSYDLGTVNVLREQYQKIEIEGKNVNESRFAPFSSKTQPPNVYKDGPVVDILDNIQCNARFLGIAKR